MPTNDERREIAARLRKNEPSSFGSLFDVWREIALAVNPNGGSYRTLPLELADLIEPEPINGETSDGYHTFNELYHHRALLFSVVVRNYPELCWKSKKHHTGDMYDGMFIVGINTPDGQASYHYDIEPYWDMFECEELEFAPEWDGHTPAQAIERIGKLTNHETERTCEGHRCEETDEWVCHKCGGSLAGCMFSPVRDGFVCVPNYCPNCGDRVVQS